MPQIQETRKVAGKPASEIYQDVLQAAPKAGLTVWKRRDIAWLAMVRTGTESDAVNGNVSVRPGSVTVALTGPNPEALQSHAERLFQELNAQV